jgi:hypothetical protein
MNALEQARQWLTDEKPGPDEIRQSIDNLCHQLAGCRSKEGQAELQAAIQLLMSQFGDTPEVTLPEPPTATQLDYGSLFPVSDEALAPISIEERRQRFETLREELERPF